MINKEVSIASIIIALMYSCSFSFNYGYASFYGLPSDIISIDINQLLSSGFVFLMTILAFSVLFHARFKDGKVSLVMRAVVYLVLILISILPWYYFAPNGYLMDKGWRKYYSAVVFLSCVLVYLLNSFFDLSENKYEFKINLRIFITIICLLSAFYITGWISAFQKPGFYTTGDNKVFLASYGGRDIFGTCIKENAEFFITKQDSEVKLSKIKGQRVDQLKICFNLADSIF